MHTGSQYLYRHYIGYEETDDDGEVETQKLELASLIGAINGYYWTLHGMVDYDAAAILTASFDNVNRQDPNDPEEVFYHHKVTELTGKLIFSGELENTIGNFEMLIRLS